MPHDGSSPRDDAPHGGDDADAIAAALARLRGRRMPRPPWAEEGSQHGPGMRGGPGWMRGGPHRGGHPHAGSPPWVPPRLGGPARMRLLETLAQASGPLSVGEIADAIGVDQPRASRLVQQGVELGVVRREADPDDARRTRVALTDAGSALVRGFRGDRREAVDRALSSFTEQERADLARLLNKLADGWPQG
ncbi:Transcriptional regulator [Microbacterium sp. C448]|uniref:MarR family winged helix-turn-helix transcriptional regulator n=1 Tax=Microbacterium TaxID=33882 RepID=UPI0003DE1ABF|nr:MULTISPECIES: MarR family winged helix-turn-helix transcriptional regulator [Microbacterium]MDO8383226.1 MarR family winged helix-turn-helix transcriptional regulator [Microbacterium sp.]CDK00077.1 Transcriptional regulator [Microbacterium sp. C448]